MKKEKLWYLKNLPFVAKEDLPSITNSDKLVQNKEKKMSAEITSIRLFEEDKEKILSKYKNVSDYVRQKVAEEFNPMASVKTAPIAIIDNKRYLMNFKEIDPLEEEKKLRKLIEKNPDDKKLLKKEYEALTGRRYKTR